MAKTPPRVPRALRPLVTEPSLLVLHEKHGDIYFHIPDEARLLVVALDILEKRDRAGYWYYEPDGPPKPPELSAGDIAKLPDGKTKDFALNAIREYNLVKRGYDNDVENVAARKKAIAEKNGRAAWQVLREHRDGEYQRVSLEGYSDSYYEYEG